MVRDLPNVRVERAILPAELPDGTFDLIVIGDLLYYLSAEDLAATVDGLLARLEPGGDLVSVHFRDRENGGSYDGFNAHGPLGGRPGLTSVVHHSDEWFLLDVWRAEPPGAAATRRRPTRTTRRSFTGTAPASTRSAAATVSAIAARAGVR